MDCGMMIMMLLLEKIICLSINTSMQVPSMYQAFTKHRTKHVYTSYQTCIYIVPNMYIHRTKHLLNMYIHEADQGIPRSRSF